MPAKLWFRLNVDKIIDEINACFGLNPSSPRYGELVRPIPRSRWPVYGGQGRRIVANYFREYVREYVRYTLVVSDF